MRTSLTDDLVSVFPTEMLLDSLRLGSILHCILQAIHEQVEELFHIHLLHHVGWVAIPVLKGMAEPFRIDVLFLTFVEPSKERLKLVEHILFFFGLVSLRILHIEDIIP